MKIVDKLLIVLFNICLIIVAIWASAVPIAKSKSYYEKQFTKNEIYAHYEDGELVQTRFHYVGGTYHSSTYYTDEQLDIIIEHIIDYLFKGKDTFELKMDNVMVNGEVVDDVNIFGEVAVTHMEDVKVLFTVYRVISWIALAGMIAMIFYFLKRMKYVKKTLLSVTLIFYGVLFLLIGIFLLIVLIHMKKDSIPLQMDWFLDTLWRDIHHLLFMFQPEKVEGSFFNDTLTEVLTLELFITAVVIVVITLVSLLALWFATTVFARKYGEKISTKIFKPVELNE